MPTRTGRLFLEHTTGELHQLQRVQMMLFMMVCASWSKRRLRAVASGHLGPNDASDSDSESAGFPSEDVACLGIATFAALAAVVPRMRVRAPCAPDPARAEEVADGGLEIRREQAPRWGRKGSSRSSSSLSTLTPGSESSER